jgi:tetratricopeptide (TPR) repeat protein
MAQAPAEPMRPELVAGRYQLLNQLGRGGMGTAHRALDRLSGRVVTLKRLNAGDSAARIQRPSRDDNRLALAQEFRLLASLRHPNIVSVLDYGFDEGRRPFFCMDLQENAQTIVDAGRAGPPVVRAELLVQLLRALAYLHRHGIIHCDIKPENVVVAGTQVKVLDFGLSVYRDLRGADSAMPGGTLAYMAPELLRGERPSERSDLYAVGVLAYELFTGRMLLSSSEHAGILTSGEGGAWLLRRPSSDLDPRVQPVIARLLAPAGERYGEASQVIAALATALGQPFDAETVATRESFLQAAPFVGREVEIELLRAALRAAEQGVGTTMLIGGESGVGKSRLIDEVRSRGLVNGFIVVDGQAVSEGGSPYHLWRGLVSTLVMRGEIADPLAGVLRAIVPDIGRLLGREVPDPPAVDPAATQSRLFLAVEDLLRTQAQPVLMLLEDLQWAGTESLALLAALARLALERPLLILGTFRSDEASTLPSRIEGARILRLPRLTSAEIAQLARTMIGAAGARPDVAAFLERETEGIPLFIVEAVRSLAEGVGALADIGSHPLPPHLASGGMRKVLQRRVDRVPAAAVAALRSAAVAGREIDPAVLRLMHPTLDIDAWLRACADAAVIELHEERGRFAHDKLREHILGELSPAEHVALHRQVAEAIERAYPNAPERDTALAHHWRLAGDPVRELAYQERSAAQALAGGAYQEAIARFERALALLGETGAEEAPASARAAGRRRRPLLAPALAEGPRLRRGELEAGLSEAHYRLGDLRACEVHAVRALAALGLATPTGRLGMVKAMLGEAAARAIQLSGVRPRVAAGHAAIETIGRVQTQLIEVYFYSLRVVPVIWSTLRQLNVTEPFGPSAELSRAYIYLAVICGVASLPRLAARWARHSVAIAEGAAAPGAVAYALNRSTAVELAHCWWEAAEAHIERADAIASAIGDMRLCEEARTEAGLLALYRGPLQPGLAPLQSAYQLSRRSGSKQGACWSLLGQGDILVRLDRAKQAVPLYEEALRRLDEKAMRTEAIWACGGLALACLRLNEPQRALEQARRAVGHLPPGTPVAYWIQHGTAAAAEVLLTLLECCPESDPGRRRLAQDAAAAVAGLRRYARRFPLGRAHALLWDGLLQWLSGRPRRALRRWHAALATARALVCPYEEARAHLEIARHLAAGDAEWTTHMESAQVLFEQTGCAEGLTLLQVERDRRRHEPRT